MTPIGLICLRCDNYFESTNLRRECNECQENT